MTNKSVKEDFKEKAVLDYMKCSEEERRAYERYKESLHYQASMYETNYIGAKIEGKIEGKIEIALSMLQEGFDVETIVKITGLNKETVLKLEKSA